MELLNEMEAHGIVNFKSDILNISYIDESIVESINTPKLREEFPQIAEICTKKTKRKAYIKVDAKGVLE